jgi:hypothetical protein
MPPPAWLLLPVWSLLLWETPLLYKSVLLPVLLLLVVMLEAAWMHQPTGAGSWGAPCPCQHLMWARPTQGATQRSRASSHVQRTMGALFRSQ